jgi:hypothetical protein
MFVSGVHPLTLGRSGLATAGPSSPAILMIPTSLRQSRRRLLCPVRIAIGNILGGIVIQMLCSFFSTIGV